MELFEDALQSEEVAHLNLAAAREQVKNESLSSEKAFDLAEDLCEALVEKYHRAEAMVGVILEVLVKNESSCLRIDTKAGPMVKIEGNKPGPKADITLTFESESQFRGVLSRRFEVEKLVKLGLIKVEGSLRQKMKLLPLLKLGKKISVEVQQKRNKITMKALDWESEPLRGTFSGELEKKSTWLRKWNSRWFTLDWDPKHRPTLSYATTQQGASKFSIELHSACSVEPRVTTRTDKSNQAAFAIVDRNAAEDILVLCAPSVEVRSEWLKKLKAAITARGRARLQATNPPKEGSTEPETEVEARPASTTLVTEFEVEDTLLEGNGTARPATVQSLQNQPTPELKEQLDALEASLIASGVESHLVFILRKFSWRLVPLVVAGTFVVRRLRMFLLRVLPSSTIGQSALVALAGVAARTIFESPNFELLRRRVIVYLLSAKLIFDLKVTDMKAEELPEIHANAVWRTKQRAVAEEMYYHALSLGGFWVKVAQSLGSRPDVFPPTITKVLGRLQDEVPPTPFEELKPYLERQLGAPLSKVFSSFEPEPIAAASIGQVHLAVLKDGSKVVVKVQHPGIEGKLRQDVYNVGVVMKWVSLIDRKLDIHSVLEHWRTSVLRELDFLAELDSMQDVGSNLRNRDEAYATVPTAVRQQGLCSSGVMIMKFVNGVKVTDLQALSSVGVTGYHARGVLANDICDAFAQQIFIDGHFNADPHPGNILVARRSDLSDGEVMHLPSTGKGDPDRAVPVLLDFGLAVRLPANVRLGLAKMVYAGSQMDAGSLLWAWDMLGVVLRREDVLDDISGLQHMFRDTAPTEESRKETMARIELEKEKMKQRNFESPVESFPPELLLFFRSLNLLRGVCSSLEVRQPFTKILAAWAKQALLERYPKTHNYSQSLKPVSPLEAKIRQALSDRENDFVGVQIAVVDDTHGLEFTVASGCLAEDDRRNVNAKTLFQASSLAQSVAQIAAHHFVNLDDVVQDPLATAILLGEWRRMEKFNIDGSRQPIDPVSVPFGFSSKTVADWRANLQHVNATVCKDHHPSMVGGECKRTEEPKLSKLPFEMTHAAFFWGWLAMKLVQDGKTGNDTGVLPAISTFCKENLRPFGEFHLGMKSVQESLALYEEGKVAQLSFPVEKLLEQHGLQDFGSMGDLETVNANGGGISIVTDIVPTLKGKEYWVDPRMMNHPKVMAACLPSGNLLTTAESMAKLFHCIGKGGIHNGQELIPPAVAERIFRAGITRDCDPFSEDILGLRKYKFQRGDKEVMAIGQITFGGNLILSFPQLAVTVSILVNQMTLSRDMVQSILDVVYEHYHLLPQGDF